MCKIITQGFQDNWWETILDDDEISTLLKSTIAKQSTLGRHSVLKGYLILEWTHIQELWRESTKVTSSKYNWGKEVVCSLHTYVYETWKARNEIVHGKSEKSLKQVKRAQLQDKVISLYQKGRANLTQKEHSYFKLPVDQRIKRGNDSLSLWIQIVTCIFHKRGIARQETIDGWLETQNDSPSDLRQPKSKHKCGRGTINHSNNTEGGEEESRS